MSCIVGLEYDGRVWLGGDSLSLTGSIATVPRQPKVYRVGSFIIGSVGSHRGHDIIQHGSQLKKLTLPGPKKIDAFMRTAFVDEVRRCFVEGGHATVEKGEEGCGTDLLVGAGSRLFRVASDYSVVDYTDGFAALGSGSDVALGVLAVTGHLRDPRRRLKKALGAAARFDIHVLEPFRVICSPRRKE